MDEGRRIDEVGVMCWRGYEGGDDESWSKQAKDDHKRRDLCSPNKLRFEIVELKVLIAFFPPLTASNSVCLNADEEDQLETSSE